MHCRHTHTHTHTCTHINLQTPLSPSLPVAFACTLGKMSILPTKQTFSCLSSLKHGHTHCSLSAHKLQHCGVGCLAPEHIRIRGYRQHHSTSTTSQGLGRKAMPDREDKKIKNKTASTGRWGECYVPVRSIVIGPGASSHNRVSLVTQTLGPERSREGKKPGYIHRFICFLHSLIHIFVCLHFLNG